MYKIIAFIMLGQYIVNRAFKLRNRKIIMLFGMIKVLPKEQVKSIYSWEWDYVSVLLLIINSHVLFQFLLIYLFACSIFSFFVMIKSLTLNNLLTILYHLP